MLPGRLRGKLLCWKTKRYLGEAIEALSPLEVATQNLRAEVHMMLGKNHLWRGLAALHTFFGYSGLADRVGVMIHTDGTIGPRGVRFLEKHIRGARVVTFPSNDSRVLAVLQEHPHIHDYYRRRVSCMTRLVHIPTLARSDRAIQLDSDIVFWSCPRTIVDWCDDAHRRPMFQIDRRGGDADPGVRVRRQFDQLRGHLRSLQGPFEIKYYYASPGLMLLPVHRFSYDLVEDYLRWRSIMDPVSVEGMYWFDEWTVELTGFLLNFATWPDAVPLDKAYGMASKPARVCNHYFKGRYYRDAVLLKIRTTLVKLAALEQPGTS